MINITVNGVKSRCATHAKDITTKQYIRIIKEFDFRKDYADWDYFHLFAILTNDENYKPTNRYKESATSDLSIIDCVSWIWTDFIHDKTLPKAIEIRGKSYEIPTNPGSLSIGQNIHLRRDYIDKSMSVEENIAIAVAIYMQPIVDGKKFDIARARELCKEIEEMPAYIIYPVGFFLLKRAINYGIRPEKNSLPILNSLKQMLSVMSQGWRRFNA